MIFFNIAALKLAVICVINTAIVAYLLDWVSFDKSTSSSHEEYVIALGGAMLAVSDLALRLQHVRNLNTAPKPTILTPAGWVPTRPQPVMATLNMFLSGEKGGQVFWVLPCWVLGLILAAGLFLK